MTNDFDLNNKPAHWLKAVGSDVFELVTSGSRGWAQHYSTEGAKFIRIGNLDHNSISLDLRDVQHVQPPTGAEGQRTRLKANDLLISITAELGMVGLVPTDFGEAYINQHIALARPQPEWNPRFLAWYFASEADGKKCLKESGRGGTKVGLGLDDVRNAPVPVPPIQEQNRIADKLDAALTRVDAVNTRLARVAPILKRFRQSVLAAATSGRLTEDWREETKTSNQWELTTIGKIATDLRYGTSKKCDFSAIGTAVLRIPNIGSNGTPDLSNLKYAEFDASERSKLSLQLDDLLIIRSNGSVDLVGKSCVVDEPTTGLLFAGYLMRLRIDSSRALPRFVFLNLSSPHLREIIEATAKSTSGVNNINSEELRGLPINLPKLEEQTEIVRRVETLFAFADRLEARLQAAQTAAERLTPALLAKAFRGELVPQDPNDEPASELLRRLQATPPSAPQRGRKRAA